MIIFCDKVESLPNGVLLDDLLNYGNASPETMTLEAMAFDTYPFRMLRRNLMDFQKSAASKWRRRLSEARSIRKFRRWTAAAGAR